jgi:hypothetical protein
LFDKLFGAGTIATVEELKKLKKMLNLNTANRDQIIR